MARYLRSYQNENIDAIRRELADGCRRQLNVMATGLGKMVSAANVPAATGLLPSLFSVDRIELANQAAEKFREWNPRLTVGIEQAGRSSAWDADIVVASIPTVSRRKDTVQRLKKWAPDHFKSIQDDESHHALCASRLEVYRYFNTELLLGHTATPFRGDGKPLARLFDKIVFNRSFEWGIENEWLCRYRAAKIYAKSDISNLHARAGDFSEEELAQVVNVDWRHSEIISGFEKWGADRKSSLWFCSDKTQAQAMTLQLKKRGHDAECVLEHTPEQERAEILGRFRDGILRNLVNVRVVSEGVDIPRIDCVVMCHPTKSPVYYCQAVGRGLRPHEDKEYLLILDIVDVCGRHDIMSASKILGNRDIDALGEDMLDVKKKLEKAAQMGLQIDDGETIDDVMRKLSLMERLALDTVYIDTESEAVELFKLSAIAPEVERDSVFDWIRVTADHYTIEMQGCYGNLWRDQLGMWRFTDGTSTFPLGDGRKAPFKDADRKVKHLSPDWRFRHRNANWKQTQPTMKQLNFMRDKMGFKAFPPSMTKGAAKHLISIWTTMKRYRGR